MNIQETLFTIGANAKAAQTILRNATTQQKNIALQKAAEAIIERQVEILAANAIDVEQANANNISGAFLDRLILTPSRVEAMANGLRQIAKLPDPVGNELARWQRPNGLDIARVAVPLGVIGVIYESRPNVTADAGALCLKAGNAAILRGGKEGFHSSHAIMQALQQGLSAAGLPKECLQLIPSKDREAVGVMLKMNQYIDVIIPRGGKGLIQRVIDESTIPTFQHLDGNCHTYIHAAADIENAVAILKNAKLRRVGICGATESLLVDKSIAAEVIPKIVEMLNNENCLMVGDEFVQKLNAKIQPATDQDWATEYLDAKISIKTVDSISEAIEHVNTYGSGHTDAILTEDKSAAEQFLTEVDSAIVMHNASTQFADGGEFGMGAEIGIATGRLHARGPVGLEQLCTFKYQVRGSGQVRG